MTEPITDVVVTWQVPAEGAELAALELWDRGATALAEAAEEGGSVVLTASFPTAAAARVVAGEVGAATREVDGSWRDAWRDHAEAVAVDGGLVVAPAWRAVDLPEGGTVLHIDPGPCFGSGSHASTRLVLGWLATHPLAGLAVLDLGAGSGILAVAAAVLGAVSVTAVDVDPASAPIVAANATRNRVAPRISASSTPALDLPTGRIDLALVNVTAGVHADVGPDAVRAVAAGGRLVLAGLLPGQWRHVAPAYEGAALVEVLALDGWEGAVLRRLSS